MTFEELDDQLPNGLHDLELHGLSLDYVGGTMEMRIKVWTGDMEGPDREEYRAGRLLITGLLFCSMEPPDPSYKFVPDGSPLVVSGDPARADSFSGFERMIKGLPSGVSIFRFFVNEWNAFIHVAAKDVQLMWDALS